MPYRRSYSELHLVCGRAAAALRLGNNWDAAEEDLLERFAARKRKPRPSGVVSRNFGLTS